ncbi:MAG: GNAT family N-acetyltransferase [Rubricoccaceae bacterium]|nr:GNAT family N-acetyltransferase [Rubricoccaceae bacterium]
MIRAITADETRTLRSVLLRPGQPPENLVYPGDDTPEALHVGAFHDGKLVGIASIYPELPPEEHRNKIPAGKAFRLRGMATTPEVRGLGYGRQLLEFCFDHMQKHNAPILWCNARIGAQEFYKRLGLQTIGPEFEIEGIGPHYVMWTVVS